MESATSRPPRKGKLLTKTPCPIHRLGDTTEEIRHVDYELVDGNFVRHYIHDDINPIGVSCFTPLGEPPHKNPISDQIDCYFLPKDTLLPQGLAIIFTHKTRLRFPTCCQKGWHFCIVPTMQMTLAEYGDAIKNLNWNLCEIKANAELKELVHKDDDLRGVRDFLITEIYLLIELWYKQTTDAMERLYANDIHTWIALKKPTLKELIRDKPRAYIIFHAISYLNATSVTQKTYKYDILGVLRDAFGWKVKEFGDEPNIGSLAETFDTMHLDDKGKAPDESADKYLRDACDAEVIRVNDELWILKDYELKDGKKYKKQVNIGCRVTNINDGKLTIALIDHEEKQNIISSLNKLEEWLLDEFKLDKEYRPKDYHNCTANILIKREGKFLGNIRECKKLKNNYMPQTYIEIPPKY
ncbi:hypothetical protein GLOIN_2v1886220 [Rhizophagus irregularis DAOM 181602=DAOM 197198]|uniref:Uncharacterized protein n=1 Tax=Rhizophagus irregularis (strain DAOM 181602 / DAOM 197198 / MUCL 43194) TaxID=747089 RepID=A0A2P4NXS5_RHIID|nr:hypothetical protein GLOIN_2v1886220 [Rhizophagus irregularis DAOM 181602=DAOM 197198]POG57927.1 hypothetical protein GLOIN_2v1886220 [Rhizophagus irregularis DAOM 181602=DAOM 197198]|eukprot:XP_025164793.1 hypothetical protein GLOIN_2v1886220 [Rhizophagus irregularis DAOM 181602=DAOM 197198]